jgi:hypothetical protein
MNRRQKILLSILVVALVTMWLFPPCIFHIRFPSASVVRYKFLFGEDVCEIDWARLLFTDLTIAVVGCFMVYALRSKH